MTTFSKCLTHVNLSKNKEPSLGVLAAKDLSIRALSSTSTGRPSREFNALREQGYGRVRTRYDIFDLQRGTVKQILRVRKQMRLDRGPVQNHDLESTRRPSDMG